MIGNKSHECWHNQGKTNHNITSWFNNRISHQAAPTEKDEFRSAGADVIARMSNYINIHGIKFLIHAMLSDEICSIAYESRARMGNNVPKQNL